MTSQSEEHVYIKEDTLDPREGLFNQLWPEVVVPITNRGGAMFMGDNQWLEQIKQGEIKENDVIISGYPKSGTHWVSEIVSVLSRDGDIRRAKETSLRHRVPFMDVKSDVSATKETTNSHITLTHLFPEMLPDQIWQLSTKIVFVLRNPKAAIISGFHFYQHLPLIFGPFKGTWEDYFQYAMGENVLYGNWFTYTEKWWSYAQRDHVHIVTYENLTRDLEGSIEKIAEFLNKDISKTKIAAISEHVKFETMKKNPMTNYSDSKFCNTLMQRKGKVDDWKNYFTVAQNESFDKIYSQRIKSESSLGQYLNDNIF